MAPAQDDVCHANPTDLIVMMMRGPAAMRAFCNTHRQPSTAASSAIVRAKRATPRRWLGLAALICAVVILSSALAGRSAACTGDCDGSGIVTIDEVVRGVNIARDVLPLNQCTAIDCQGTGRATVDCLVQAVDAALNGCTAAAATPSFTPSMTATATATPRASATPPLPTPTGSPPTPSPTSSPRPFPAQPVRLILQGQPAALLSISGTSAADVYAVGADGHDGMGPYILHYDGQDWRRLDSGVTGNLWWISVAPIDGSFYMAGENGTVLRYGLSTQAFEKLPSLGAQTLLFGIWGTDANHLWAVGADLSNTGANGVVWGFDGTRWTLDTAIKRLLAQGVPILYKVWGRDENDLYVVGQRGVVVHFDGSLWTQSTVDLNGADPANSSLFTIHGNATEAVAVGFGTLTNNVVSGLVLESQGTSFQNAAPPGTPQINGVFMRPDGTGVAVGIAGTVAFRSAGGWQLQQPGLNTPRDFHAAWVDPAGGVWAVGGNLSTDLDQGILAYGGTEAVGNNVLAAGQPPNTTPISGRALVRSEDHR
jgi:hypothetical protein